jgi:hypothetical protein
MLAFGPDFRRAGKPKKSVKTPGFGVAGLSLIRKTGLQSMRRVMHAPASSALIRRRTLPGERLMPERKTEKSLPETQRKEIFLALVEAQDHEMSVAQSRALIAERFSVSEDLIRQIEREGLDQQWPPLD